MSTSALVTGGGSGIGAATVRLLTGRGMDVTVLDLDGAAAAAVVASIEDEEVRARSAAIACDVTSPDDVDRAVSAAFTRTARLDAVVCCAGLAGRSARLESLTLAEWQQVVAVNLWGVVHVSRAVTPVLREQRSGSVVHVASIAGVQGSRGQVPYSAAKAGVIGLTQAMAKELLQFGVRVNAVAPGFIRTPMTDDMTEQVREAWGLDRMVLGGTLGSPEQVAACIGFLCSDDASFLTGVTLPVDGGFVLGYP
jgi:NAD(P)-dependent dehydrogenase (short-subunit alcohol dehydrogenase family)